ncbi:hypothetical protein ICJ84_11435 [Aestuariibaculum suncheonense]|uniref:Uncharacterized protein n=2 Tax=Aestuariibaculum suncheonense TaxID=1028745 RepID=A0A8J6UB71_9FLAO|nr:hypothetical protein [Aestuariibaculum suncheonense]MBD0836053.1 hypothetical protein [Aestuariibaculum suncheonense]
MAFVVLFTTMSFTLNMHYCGDTLVEMAVFHEAKGCGMEMVAPSTEVCTISKKNCCDDKQLVVEGQDELQQSFEKTSFNQQLFVASFVYTFISLFEGEQQLDKSYIAYKPPLVSRQIYKLVETYLI